MKGRMDILNFKKKVSLNTQMKHFRTETSSFKDTVKIVPDDEQEKENCEDISDSSDLIIDTNHKYINRNLNNSKNDMSDDDDEETELVEEYSDSNVPLLSVILKEGDNVVDEDTLYNKRVPPVVKPKNDVEIKYEDDIEEEEYDSDEESVSVDQSDMPELTRFQDEISNSMSSGSSFHKPNSDLNQAESITNLRFFNPNYFESSMLNFQIGGHNGRNSVGNETNDDSENISLDNTSDSVLLSIVYATINVPFSQVSKFLTAYNLSKLQLSVIRKVRRQVKNRLYAQNCRRRRVAHIRNLANELKQIKTEKEKLISQRGDLTAKKMSLQCRYKQLHNHVMHILSEKYRYCSFQLTDNNMNLSEPSQIQIQKRKLAEEREQMEFKKRKIENKYEELHKHVFSVIATRNHNNTMGSNVLDNNSIDFKLCNMNIVNELAMLNKYWAKNIIATNESIEMESSVSVDGSRTSENKLNDFVDYESSVSVDDSRFGESALNDFIDYESSVDESVIVQNGHINISSKEDVAELDFENTGIAAENGRVGSDSAMAWTENSDAEEDSEEDEFEMDEFDELEEEQDELEQRKKTLGEQYEQLYNIVWQALQVNESEFLKMFMDYCLQLLKIPGRDLSSIAFNGG